MALKSDMLVAQEIDTLIPVNETLTGGIDPAYAGKRAWHKVHKRTANKFIGRTAESTLSPHVTIGKTGYGSKVNAATCR